MSLMCLKRKSVRKWDMFKRCRTVKRHASALELELTQRLLSSDWLL